MADPNRFSAADIATLAKRAGQRCSSPWCDSITSGPSDAPDESVITGEAAHIRGANQTSARYDRTMTPEQRSVITNGIWLCRVCARLIDRDERRFPVEVLYRWKTDHEERIRRAQGGGTAEHERRK